MMKIITIFYGYNTFYEFVRHDKLLALLSRYIKEQKYSIIQQYRSKWLSAGSVEIKKPELDFLGTCFIGISCKSLLG